jgi:hypothetical protein
MSNVDSSPRDVNAIITRYKSIGFFGGLFLGGVVGVVAAGPHFAEWSGFRSVVTILGGFGVGGLIGYIAGEIAIGSQASGAFSGIGGGGGDGSSTGDSGGGDSGGGGGGGGDGGGGGGDS